MLPGKVHLRLRNQNSPMPAICCDSLTLLTCSYQQNRFRLNHFISELFRFMYFIEYKLFEKKFNLTYIKCFKTTHLLKGRLCSTHFLAPPALMFMYLLTNTGSTLKHGDFGRWCTGICSGFNRPYSTTKTYLFHYPTRNNMKKKESWRSNVE